MPVDRGAIDAQLREIGEGERWWEQREFRDLPFILSSDERIHGLTQGSLRQPLMARGRWLLVVTNQRLLCLKQERFARKQVDIPVTEIVKVQQRNRLRAHQITIATPDRRYRLRIPKADAFRFAGALSAALPKSATPRLSPELEPLAWLPGIETVAALPGVSGIVSRVSMLSPPEYATQRDVQRLELVIERLNDEVARLGEQVEFLEGLLQKRAEEAFLPPSSGES